MYLSKFRTGGLDGWAPVCAYTTCGSPGGVDPECVKDLGWVPNDWTYKFSPDHVKDTTVKMKNTPNQRSHQMELRSRDK